MNNSVKKSVPRKIKNAHHTFAFCFLFFLFPSLQRQRMSPCSGPARPANGNRINLRCWQLFVLSLLRGGAMQKHFPRRQNSGDLTEFDFAPTRRGTVWRQRCQFVFRATWQMSLQAFRIKHFPSVLHWASKNSNSIWPGRWAHTNWWWQNFLLINIHFPVLYPFVILRIPLRGQFLLTFWVWDDFGLAQFIVGGAP